MLCVLLRDLRLRNIPLKYTTPSLCSWYMLLLKVYTLFITLVHDTCVIKFHGGANILLYEVYNRYSFQDSDGSVCYPSSKVMLYS